MLYRSRTTHFWSWPKCGMVQLYELAWPYRPLPRWLTRDHGAWRHSGGATSWAPTSTQRPSLLQAHLLVVPAVAGRARLGLAAGVLGLDVLGLGLVERAAVEAVGHDGDIDPRRRVPVREVVALLGALVAPAVVVGVLPGVDGRAVAKGVVPEVLVGGEDAAVALAAVALVVVLPRLVEPAVGLYVVVLPGRALGLGLLIFAVGEFLAVGGGAVAEPPERGLVRVGRGVPVVVVRPPPEAAVKEAGVAVEAVHHRAGPSRHHVGAVDRHAVEVVAGPVGPEARPVG